MNKKELLFLVGLVACWAGNVNAAENNLQTELKQAQTEIQQLRTEMAELKNSSSWQYQTQLKQVVAQMPTAAKDEGGGGLILPAGWSIKPHGYIKLDLVYDTSSNNAGNYLLYVNPETATNNDDDMFSATARQTRLGMDVLAPNIGDLEVMGRVEVDFYNPQIDQENKSTPMMRHAYGQLKGADWSVLFGQTSDVVSPLFPDTLNYTIGWLGGNIGYRSPQLRYTKTVDCPTGEGKVKMEVALARQNGQDYDGVLDDGQDEGAPTVQARISGSSCGMQAGVSGHYGREEVNWATCPDLHTWSLNGDLVVPLCPEVELKGEVFWGENLNSYLGGIGQGANTATHDEIESFGGWAQIGLKPCDEWAVNAGAGIDDPTDSDLAAGARSENVFAFANVNYFFSKYLLTGIELTCMRTESENGGAGTNYRIQNSWMVKF